MLAIIQHTPLYVLAILAVLTALGIQALRSRTVPIWRLLLTPALFIGWGVVSLVLQSTQSPIPLLDWLGAAAVGGAIGWTTIRLDQMRVDRARLTVSLPGSALPLIRNLLIFATKYALGVALALAPARGAELALWYVAVSGLSAGYFLGWLARFLPAYRRTTFPIALVQASEA